MKKNIIACIFIGALFFLLIDRYTVLALVLLLAAVIGFFWLRTKRPSTDHSQDLPNLTKSKEEYYKKLGLMSQEIDFFRSTMNTTKNQIHQLQANVNRSTKLKMIDLRNDTLKVAKAIFKELVKEPQKLHLANHFLYTHLPNLVELTNKHIEIEAYEVKNKQIYEKLEENAQIIDQVSKLILKDYEELVADDLEDLDVEISIAKNSLNRDNGVKKTNDKNDDEEQTN